MKLDFSLNWKQFKEMPEPLQKPIAARWGFAFVFLFLFFLFFNLTSDVMTTVPIICLSAFCGISAAALFYRAVTGKYIIIRGRVAEITCTPFRRRPKAVLLQTDDHLVQINLRRRLARFRTGSELTVYAASDTPVYEKDGIMILQAYMAMNMTGGERNAQRVQSSRSS